MGTLARWDPPQHLVVVGLYRFTRNPIYVGVLLIVGGWSVFSSSPILAAYSLVLALAFHMRVVFGEEQWLAGQLGTEWATYSASVSRWVSGPAPWYKEG